MQTDRIESTVVIAAPLERVWDLVTSPEHAGRWFGDAGAEIDLRPGGAWRMTFTGHGTYHGRVVAVSPPHRFAYRWHTVRDLEEEPTPANSTLTEFTLLAETDGTRVTVVESGFDALAVDAAERTRLLASHTSGWTAELGELVAYAR